MYVITFYSRKSLLTATSSFLSCTISAQKTNSEMMRYWEGRKLWDESSYSVAAEIERSPKYIDSFVEELSQRLSGVFSTEKTHQYSDIAGQAMKHVSGSTDIECTASTKSLTCFKKQSLGSNNSIKPIMSASYFFTTACKLRFVAITTHSKPKNVLCCSTVPRMQNKYMITNKLWVQSTQRLKNPRG